MEYNEFLNCVKDYVKSLCDEKDNVIIHQVVKNNSLMLDGLVIQKEGAVVSPTIYLNRYYEEYLDGKSIAAISHEVIELDRGNRYNFSFPIEEFYDFKLIKDRIVYKLVNTDRNKVLLDMIPHRDYLDFSIIYYCLLDNIDGTFATTLIYDTHINLWEITEEDLFEIASENTSKTLVPVIKNMSMILSELLGNGEFGPEETKEIEEELRNDNNMPMYVITNKEKIFGASCILYPGLLHDFGLEHGNFYILPSSIHEVIFIPENESIIPDNLCDMVKEVNSTQVSIDEILSDKVYYYSILSENLSEINNVNDLSTLA